MKSKTALKIIALYGVIISGLAIVGTILSFNNYNNASVIIAFIIELGLLGVSIVLLVPHRNEATTRGFAIAEFVIYSAYIFMCLIVLIVDPLLGLVSLILYGIPFAFGIVYLIRYAAEDHDNMVAKPSFITTIDEEERKIKAYEFGQKYFAEKEYELALQMFEKIPNYKDSNLQVLTIKEILIKEEKEKLLSELNAKAKAEEVSSKEEQEK